MIRKYTSIAILIFSLFSISIAQTHYYVNPSGNDSNDGLSPGSPKQTIAAAISTAANGDTIHLANGTYTQSSTLYVNKQLTLIGDSESGVVIDVSAVPSSGWGINVNQSNSSLINMTITPKSASGGGFPIHVSSNTSPRTVISNITLSHITIDGSYRTPFDINGVDNVTLSYLTATNTTHGNGVQVSACTYVNADHITTNNNVWGGFAIYSYQDDPSHTTGINRGSDHITIDGTTSSFGEANKVYSQDEFGFTNTNITVNGFDYIVRNTSYTGYTWYQIDQTSALAFAAALSPASDSYVIQISTGYFFVDTSLKIQTAVNAATSGDTLYVLAGTYSESVTINKPLTIIGVGNPTVTEFIFAASPINIIGFSNSSTDNITVNSGGSIEDAINIVSSGGTIHIQAGTYNAIVVNKPVTIIGSDGTIINHGSPAITVSSTGVTLTGLTFTFDSSDFAIDVLGGAYDVTIDTCNFLNTNGANVGNGVRNQGTGTVTARYNYWGSGSGPTISSNPCGKGAVAANTSTGTLIYSPWFTDTTHTALLSAPTLISPANLSTGISITPTFQWSLSYGSSPTFELQIAYDQSFTTIVYDTAGITSPFTLPLESALTNSTIYYWKIIAVVGSDTTCSSPWKFTTIAPAKPQLVYPQNATTINGQVINFQWYPSPWTSGTLKYKIEVAADSLFTTFVSGFPDSLTVSGYVTYNFPFNFSILPPGTYYWRVKSYTTGGVFIDVSSTWQFVIPGPPTAIPSYPTGGTVVYTTSPTIYWYLNNYYGYSNTIYYRVRYGTSSGTYTDTSATTTSLYQTISGLTVGQTYYYVVDASTSSSFTTYTTSLEQSFVVYYSNISSVPIYQSYPIGGQTVYTSTPTLYWYLSIYIPAPSFDIQVDVNNSFSSPLINVTGVTGYYYTTSSLSDGTYYWRIKFTGSSTWFTESFVVNTNLSGSSSAPIPTPWSPTGGQIVYTQSPVLQWYAYSSSTLEYQVIWSSDPTLSGGVLVNTSSPNGGSSGWLTTTSYSLSGLTQGVTYYWQVRSRLASNNSIVSNYSSVAQFTVDPGASPVVLLPANPVAGVNINSTSAVLSWVVPAASKSPLSYDLEISKNPDMTSPLLINDLKQPIYKAQNLENNTRYYWRVRSKTKDGYSSQYSYKGEFSTGTVTAVTEEKLPTDFSLSQNYPNPFNPTTRITYSLPENAFVTLKIYDILGREVRTLVNQEVNRGVYNVDWDGKDEFGNHVASGTYIYRLVAGKYVSVKKMILIK
ncbi:FlgD immunoglobulin-like domain containing protein [Melioribacteraceae bacterium 4301-Me]|uniref:FlgD immunoglobulin-like domain containing protein n=1 Tax=Pyranulibacter aquaticus TaxID=3163344 RepID=UPI00359ADC05